MLIIRWKEAALQAQATAKPGLHIFLDNRHWPNGPDCLYNYSSHTTNIPTLK